MSGRHHFEEDMRLPGAGKNAGSWEPRSRLVSGALFIFGVISLGQVTLLTAVFIFTLLFSLCSGLNYRQLQKKLLLLLPFLLLMTVPILFSAGYPPAADRIELALLIVLKALTAMTFTIYIFIDHPIEEMLEAMEYLKVPAVVATVIYLTYRYAFLFIQEVQTTLRALKSRLFSLSLSHYSLKVYGELAGGLFISSINRSENVYRAMASRGFDGKMPVGNPQPLKKRDWARASLPPLFVLFLILFEQAVLK